MSFEDTWSLANFVHLRNYINSIGAEQLSFKRYLIKEYTNKHYYIEKYYISITDEGEIICPDEYKPSEAVANLIKTEIEAKLKSGQWPVVIPFGENQLREFLRELGDNCKPYRFYIRGSKLARFSAKRNSSADEDMIMLQVREDYENGNKAYKPWSYFSDGRWRQMECDEKLPFFKPKTKTIAAKIMLHEGAKAALAAQEIADAFREGKSQHPWAKDLAEFEHWGAIGGALAIHRGDYAELTDEKPSNVVYMCDNDELGQRSLSAVSQCYGKKMDVIKFDERWKYSWDIADDMPESFFDANKYIGPSLKSLMHPATWATKEVSRRGSKVTYDLTDAFMATWVFCVSPKLFINIDKPSYYHNEDQFNDRVKHLSDVKKTSELLINKFSTKVDCLMYDPGKNPGIYNTGTNQKDSLIKFNMHVAPTIPSKTGDDSLWRAYLDHMFPSEKDRYEMKRWIATLIARPDVKINYAVLLISETQGVGKSTLASYILAPLLGENNVSYPEESVITESKFTSWQVRKRLAIVNEIYAGHSYKAYNRLKSVITEPNITVEEKYQPTYDIQNWCHIFACSNDERAIKFTIDDRRWLIPLVTEKKWSLENWKKFHNWLKVDGLCIIKNWAEEFVKADPKNVILPGAEAPMSDRKKQVYETSLSEGERIILSRMEEIKEAMMGQPFYVSINDLRRYIAMKTDPQRNNVYFIKPVDSSSSNPPPAIDESKMNLSNVKESAYRIKKMLKSNGFFSNGSQIRIEGDLTYIVGNDKSEIEHIMKASTLDEGPMVRIPLLAFNNGKSRNHDSISLQGDEDKPQQAEYRKKEPVAF